MPVFRESLDDPVGLVHIKDLMAHIAGTAGPQTAKSADSPARSGDSVEEEAAKLDLASVLRPMFDLATAYFEREMEVGTFKPQDARQLLITGYGALLSYFSDEPFLEGLLDVAPLSEDALAAREEHVVQFFSAALLPERYRDSDPAHRRLT